MLHPAAKACALAVAVLLAHPALAQEADRGLGRGAGQDDEERPEPKPASDCRDLYSEEHALLERLKEEESGFFDSDGFACDEHLLRAENMAPILRKLGEKRFAGRETPYDGSAPVLMQLRRLVTHDAGYSLLRIDCRIGQSAETGYKFPPSGIGGEIITVIRSGYAPRRDGSYRQSIGAADCEFIRDLLDEFEPLYIEQVRQRDINGAISFHPGDVLTEAVDENGLYHVWLRQTGTGYIDDEDSDRVEDMLDRIFTLYSERSRETAKRRRR